MEVSILRFLWAEYQQPQLTLKDHLPSPISHKVLSSAVSTISFGTFLAFCVFESRQTIVKRPSIKVSVSGVFWLPELPGFVPSILTTTSIDEDPVHVTNPLNFKSLLVSNEH